MLFYGSSKIKAFTLIFCGWNHHKFEFFIEQHERYCFHIHIVFFFFHLRLLFRKLTARTKCIIILIGSVGCLGIKMKPNRIIIWIVHVFIAGYTCFDCYLILQLNAQHDQLCASRCSADNLAIFHRKTSIVSRWFLMAFAPFCFLFAAIQNSSRWNFGLI